MSVTPRQAKASGNSGTDESSGLGRQMDESAEPKKRAFIAAEPQSTGSRTHRLPEHGRRLPVWHDLQDQIT